MHMHDVMHMHRTHLSEARSRSCSTHMGTTCAAHRNNDAQREPSKGGVPEQIGFPGKDQEGTAGAAARTVSPTVMLPESASSRPKIILNSVVLPAPLPPMMPTARYTHQCRLRRLLVLKKPSQCQMSSGFKESRSLTCCSYAVQGSCTPTMAPAGIAKLALSSSSRSP